MKRVKLILEYDMGEYEDDYEPSENPVDWEDSFYQSDVIISDMKIIDVEVKET